MNGSKNFQIRKFRVGDRDTVRGLCCDTGFLGNPIDPVFEDRRLFADFLTAYYTDWEPESAFVIEVDGQVKGYPARFPAALPPAALQHLPERRPLPENGLALLGLQRPLPPLRPLDPAPRLARGPRRAPADRAFPHQSAAGGPQCPDHARAYGCLPRLPGRPRRKNAFTARWSPSRAGAGRRCSSGTDSAWSIGRKSRNTADFIPSRSTFAR